MRLPDSEDFAGFGLRESTLPDKAINLQREPGTQLFLFRVSKSEVGEEVAAGTFRRRFKRTL
jgi:hypothetical protein